MRLIGNIVNKLTAKKAVMTTFDLYVAIHRRTGNVVGYFNAINEGRGYKTSMVYKSLASAVDDNLFYENVLSEHFIAECDIFKIYEYDIYEHEG